MVAARTRLLPVTYLVAPAPSTGRALLWAGAGWRVRVDRGWLGQALSILVAVITWGCSGRGLWDVKMTDVVLAAPG